MNGHWITARARTSNDQGVHLTGQAGESFDSPVGCSHPGIDKIVQTAAAIDPHIHIITGGFHLVVASDPDIDKIVTGLRDTYKVEYVAPGHCTGEPAFAALKKAFGDHYVYAGLGTTVTLSATSRSLP